jgi:hypothetical protein
LHFLSFLKKEEPSLLTISTTPFVTSLTLFKIEEYSISYDESWFIHQSLFSHMDMLTLVAFWCDVVSPKGSSIMEVESFHNSFKPYKISKLFSSFPLVDCKLQWLLA